ncbi:hypothetical protein K491DRAFT_718143 [Lophiostoma macrostomum CBS 122681]|uniref:Uncharacterized protein n=1 Tax=Lophiostoma macrostomum CBS 122681 TaxID=1314788 RepID=A0A6A6T0K1_9PLEO|nr:hypothetical protein K491DRAFT_718143 [Lophiostoma macrostomum CBS 122681]
MAETTELKFEGRFSTDTAYREEEATLLQLYNQRARAMSRLEAAHATKNRCSKLAKPVQDTHLIYNRGPEFNRARRRANHLKSIENEDDAEWTKASTDLTTAKANLHHHIETYVKPSSLVLCRKIRTLPREIRDKIYTALLLTVFNTRRATWYTRTSCNEFGSPELQHRIWDDDDALPIHRFGCAASDSRTTAPYHLWDAAFVGGTVRREMIEAFYRVSRFYLVFRCSTYHKGMLHMLLHSVVWGKVRPVDFIGNVVFRLGWREHLACAKRFRKGTKFTAHLEMDRFFVYHAGETMENFRVHVSEMVGLARDVRADGYRVRIFMEGELLDLDKDVEEGALQRWMNAYKQRTDGL